MNILVTGNLPPSVLAKIQAEHTVTIHADHHPISQEVLMAKIGNQHGLLCFITDIISPTLIDHAVDLRIIANFGVGYNNIDVAAATQRGILVTNTPGVLTDATADLAMALILAVGRRLVEGDRMVREGRFAHWMPFQFLGHEISGKTLGIIGMGRIGAAVAQRASGFNMRLLYHKRHRLPDAQERTLGTQYCDLKTLLQQSDYVSLHLPLTNETRHFIGQAELAMMKSHAFLINTARGAVVDEQALVEALRSGRIAGAGLDVYEQEPILAPGLVSLDNVVLLPHVGSATEETRHAMAVIDRR